MKRNGQTHYQGQRIIYALFFGMACMWSSATVAQAQIAPDPDTGADAAQQAMQEVQQEVELTKGVQISPLRFETTLKPGQSWPSTLNLKNYTEDTKYITLSAENFVVTNKAQSASFYASADADKMQAPDIIDWIEFPQKAITLKPGEAKNITFTVHVPHTAPTGGYYGAVFATVPAAPIKNNENTVLGVNSRMGALLIFAVEGTEPINIEGSVLEFAPQSSIALMGPAQINTTIKNTGNLHFRGAGSITLERFGTERTKLPVESQVNYPDKERAYMTKWHFGFLDIGKYTATLNYANQSNTVALTATTTFWVIPWLWIVLVAALLMMLIGMRSYVRNRYHISRK